MAININNAKKVFNALLSANIPLNYIKMIMAQSSFETGGFNDKKLNTLNNASGITFINNTGKQKNASKGTPLPAKENTNLFYAKFDTLKDWALDHWRIVKKRFEGVTSLKDYATKLKSKGYFSGSLNDYIKGLQYYSKQFDKIKIYDSISQIEPINIILFAALGLAAYLYATN